MIEKIREGWIDASNTLKSGFKEIGAAIWRNFWSVVVRGKEFWQKVVTDNTNKYFGQQTAKIWEDLKYYNTSSMKEVFKTVRTKPRWLMSAPFRYSRAGLQSLGIWAAQSIPQWLKLGVWTWYDLWVKLPLSATAISGWSALSASWDLISWVGNQIISLWTWKWSSTGKVKPLNLSKKDIQQDKVAA